MCTYISSQMTCDFHAVSFTLYLDLPNGHGHGMWCVHAVLHGLKVKSTCAYAFWTQLYTLLAIGHHDLAVPSQIVIAMKAALLHLELIVSVIVQPVVWGA